MRDKIIYVEKMQYNCKGEPKTIFRGKAERVESLSRAKEGINAGKVGQRDTNLDYDNAAQSLIKDISINVNC